MSVLLIGLLSLLPYQTISAQGLKEHKSFDYHVISSTPTNHLYPGKILGVTHGEEETRIISTQILEGSLPEGIAMFDDGTLAVTQQSEQLKPGKYKVKAEFIDVKGNRFIKKLKFEFLEPVDFTDVETSIRMAKAKLTNHYKAGDIIAQFRDPNGAIKEAKLIKGALPAGVTFVQNKNFVVTQPNELKDGEYFCLFFLSDEKGGNSVLAVSLSVGLQMGEKDPPTVDTIDE